MVRAAGSPVPVMDEKATKKSTRATGRTTASRRLSGPWGASFDGKGAKGLRFERRWTRPGVHPYDEIAWELRTANIASESGKTVFEQKDVEVPSFWSQLATNVVVSKYFRGHVGTPERERSVRQLIDRVVNTIAAWAETRRYFAADEDLAAFRAELTHLLVHQKMAFNSPVWFNVGIEEKPQCSACMPYRSLVSTPGGMIPIGRLVEDVAIGREVYDANGVTRIVAVKTNGRKPVRRIRLRNGNFVEATPDHVVRAVRQRRAAPEWLRVDELEVGMRMHLHPHRAKVATRALVPAGIDAAGELTEFEPVGQQTAVLRAEAALAGWLQADGFVGQYESGTNRSLTIEFQVANDDEYRWVMENLDVALPLVHLKVRDADTKETRVQRIRIYGEAVRDFVERWGLLERGTEIRAPSRLWTASYDEICAYLRSLFQADGYIAVRRTSASEAARVGFAVISERWTEDVQLLLNTLGIYSRRVHKRERRPDRHDLHEVAIAVGSERARFAELIGFVGREEHARLLGSLGLRDLRTVPNVREEEIVAIEDLGVEDVYDIQTESGEFLSNNVAVHNCFINSVADNMGSIMDLAKTEAMLFKFGSGAGSNLSPIRSSKERMSGGGMASGPVSFMKGYDSFAGVIKSGGKTRRAAKMVILDVDHPDILDFIDSKASEERKAWALIEAGYDPSFTGEAYGSVYFQNANHSVRVTDDFMRAVVEDRDWTTHAVTTGEPMDTFKARFLFRRMAEAAHLCGDPGIQYDTTINDWNPVSNSARQYATNPCVTGDTLVATDEGWRSIESMVGETANVIGSDGRPHRVTNIFPTGRKQVFELKTRAGYRVRITADHKVATARGDVPVRDLTNDDRILLEGPGFGRTLLASRLAEAIGLAVGDGCLTWSEIRGREQPMVVLTMHRDEARVLGNVAAELNAQKQLLKVAGSPGRNDDVHVSFSSTGSRLAFASRPVVELFMRYAVLDEGSSLKRFKPAVHSLDRPSMSALLRGLFTADGTVVNSGVKVQYVGLDSTSLELLVQVQRLLLGFGVKSKIYENRRGGRFEAVLPDGKGGMKTYPVQEMHSLRITRSSRITFEREIGFMPESAKSAALAALNASVGTYRDEMLDDVASVTPLGHEDVFDLTEQTTSHFVANGLVVHNCSEFSFINDTSCNLASLNLMKFVRDDGEFDVDDYRYACRLTITAQEILVDNASYPTPKIEENSHRFRPLGLGYANLGALLMSRGLAYDSPEGGNFAAALTSIMTAEAYRQSAVIARDHGGPFIEYEKNREPFLRVIGKHRDAACQIPESGVPADVLQSARALWDETLELGERFGYRNAQTSLLAPTGTIAFYMDCDTTGIEPDIALIKYKKLVGEGFIKIVNNTVPIALRRLGYTPQQTEEIVAYIDERETIEGAPALKPEHLSVFDCAFKPVNGTRSIHYMGHVRMMAAVQPFLSGAISKTVNMPEAATAEEIEQVYLEGWKLGLKAIAIYRDGSKRSQPLSTGKKKDADAAEPEAVAALRAQLAAAQVEAGRPHRHRLPTERTAITHKFDIAGHEGYITVGLYPDGQPGEIFLKMAKEGSTVSGLMDTFATAISLALQYGVPLRDLVNKFAHVRFEPSGFTGNQEIPIAKSIVDYIFRWLGSRFLPADEKASLGLIDRSQVVSEAPAPFAPAAAVTPKAEEGPSAIDEAVSESTAGGAPAEPPADAPKATAVATERAEAPRVELSVVGTNGHANGNGAGNGGGTGAPVTLSLGGTKVSFQAQADAPSCADCGSIMVRNGSCYKCLNCGSTSGCS